MDWKRLVQFALLGRSDLEQYALLLVRVSLGLFFAISGANKLFIAGRTQAMYETLVAATVPFPHLMTHFVSGVECVDGSLLTVGFLSSLACVALMVDMLVAILTTKLSAMPKGFSLLNWLDDFLYLPEVLYVLLYLVNLLWSGKVRCRLLARNQVAEMIVRRSRLLLYKNSMVTTGFFEPEDWPAGLRRGVNAQIAFSKCRSSTRRDMEGQNGPNCSLEISGCRTADGAQARYRW